MNKDQILEQITEIMGNNTDWMLTYKDSSSDVGSTYICGNPSAISENLYYDIAANIDSNDNDGAYKIYEILESVITNLIASIPALNSSFEKTLDLIIEKRKQDKSNEMAN